MNVLLVGSVSMLVLTVVAGLKLRPPQRARFQRHNPSVSANMSATDQLNTPSVKKNALDESVEFTRRTVHTGHRLEEEVFFFTPATIVKRHWLLPTLSSQPSCTQLTARNELNWIDQSGNDERHRQSGCSGVASCPLERRPGLRVGVH